MGSDVGGSDGGGLGGAVAKVVSRVGGLEWGQRWWVGLGWGGGLGWGQRWWVGLGWGGSDSGEQGGVMVIEERDWEGERGRREKGRGEVEERECEIFFLKFKLLYQYLIIKLMVDNKGIQGFFVKIIGCFLNFF